MIYDIETRRNTHLKSIQASGHELSPSALSKLAYSLIGSPVHSVSVGHSSMGDEGVVAFCAPLEVHQGGLLRYINFEYKNIGPRGIEAIGRAFSSSKHLIELNLSRNPSIGDDGIKSFASVVLSYSNGDLNQALDQSSNPIFWSMLQMLDLSMCGIGCLGLAELTNVLLMRKLESRIGLKLDANPLGASSCHSLGLLLSGSFLSSLSVKGCSIGDEGLEVLYSSLPKENVSGLVSLNLSGNNIGPCGSRFLAAFISSCNSTCLKELNLSMNQLGADGVLLITEALQKQREKNPVNVMDTLDLSSTMCGVQGAISVLTCNAARSIILFDNSLGSDLLSLSPFVVGGHPTIEYLDLGGNKADAGALHAILNSLMEKNNNFESNLKTLILAGNSTDEAIETIVEQLTIVHPELDIAIDRHGH